MENVKLKALEQYAHDYMGNNITFTLDNNLFKGSDGHYYSVLTTNEINEELIIYSKALSDDILYDVITLCNINGLQNITNFITINRDILFKEVDSTELKAILGVTEVLDDEYGWVDDSGLHYFTICKVS